MHAFFYITVAMCKHQSKASHGVGMTIASCRFMKPENLLSSLVPVYPPEGSSIERTGYLPGERVPTPESSPRMVIAIE